MSFSWFASLLATTFLYHMLSQHLQITPFSIVYVPTCLDLPFFFNRTTSIFFSFFIISLFHCNFFTSLHYMRQLFAIHHCPQFCTNIVAPLFFGCMSMPLQLMQNQIHVFFLCDNILIFTNFSHDSPTFFVATLL